MAKALRLAALSVAALAVVGALGVGRAQAGLFGCSYPAISQPFAAWADTTSYYLDPGGNFEGGSPWRLAGGAGIVPGNESYHVDGAGDSHSLVLPPGAAATGPASCIFGTDLSVRMFAKSATAAPLRVDVMVPSVLGLLKVATSFTVPTTADWQPTRTIVNLANVLALTDLGGDNIYLRLSSPGGGTVQVDDVYVDPRCSG